MIEQHPRQGRRLPYLRATAMCLMAALLTGCFNSAKEDTGNGGSLTGSANSSGDKKSGNAGGAGGSRGPVTVGYVVVQQTNVPLSTELAGRTSAFQSSQVRPQVSGVVLHRFFTEGSIVRAGQKLYEIDPSLYRAAADQASANLASAQATAEAARIKADRYRPLAQAQAVAAQDYTDAAAQSRQTAAAVLQSRATLQTARINLRFTTVPAPITGRIGRSLFTEGALVTSGQADPLAVIDRLDPIYVDIQQPSANILALRRQLATGGQVAGNAQVRLALEDGSQYGLTGSVQFSEATVNQNTGTVTIRARFPNPNGLLLPGMFVRATFVQSVDPGAFLVPQQAISRDPKGSATLYVVGSDNKAVARNVATASAQGPYWVVNGGLHPGDKVITQGLAHVKPGAALRPVPASAAQKVEPPKQDARGKGGSGSGGQG